MFALMWHKLLIRRVGRARLLWLCACLFSLANQQIDKQRRQWQQLRRR